MKYLAAVRVRGEKRMRGDLRDALFTLRLRAKNTCIVIPDTPQQRGALIKVKDFVAYGSISAEMKATLEEKRGEKDADGKLKPYFRLHPPRGGHERKGIKKSFSEGGVTGYRGPMDELLQRMV